MTTIRDRVITVIADQTGVREDKLTDDAHFVNDLGFDSLDQVEIVMELEEELDIQIPDDRAEQIQTVGQAVALMVELTTEAD